MSQQIDVPGHGLVEFPDGMTDEQIVKAIQANPAPTEDTGYIQGRINAVKGAAQQAVSPDFWKQLGNFPPVTPDTVKQINQAAYETGLSALSTTPMSAASRAGMLNPQTLTPKQEILSTAQKAGLVVPPSEINPNSLNVMESISGKAGTRQGASIRNQPIVNKLITEDLGLSKNTNLTPKILQDIRSTAGEAYQAVKDVKQPFQTTDTFLEGVKNLSGDMQQAAQEFPDLFKNQKLEDLVKSLTVKEITPTGAVELSKKLRFDAKTNLKGFDDPEKQALGLAQRKAANLLEDLISENLTKNGQGNLAKTWEKARILIAKSHDAESALNVDGNIDARVIGKMLDKGKPMSGGFETVGKFASTFPNAVQDVSRIGSPNVSKLQAVVSATLGGAGHLSGIPGASTAATLPFIAPPAARAALFSKYFQNRLTGFPSTSVSNFSIQRGIMANSAQSGLLGGPERLGLNPYGILGQ